jgi:hypothetical protein
MKQTWIAEEEVVFLHPNGRRVPGRIAVGLPVQVHVGEADCTIALDGYEQQPGPLKGGSTLQALLLAVRFIGTRLHDFLSKGGRVLNPEDDSDFELEASFGSLLRRSLS